MKNFISILLFLLIGDALFNHCANPMSPSGGLKDTIPPSLISSDPFLGQTNVEQTIFRLTFSEHINADKLNQDLIIIPKTDIRFKHIIKKKELILTFEEPFRDSTTYSLNFFDGVTDITEKTPAVNLLLAFSTGDFIDSMKVSGTVQDLLTQEPSSKYTVGLYPISDTLDFLSQNPLYFTTSSDSGLFTISHLKTDDYRILAFNDANKNLTLDPDSEEHGFLADTLSLYDSLITVTIPTLLQNVKPLQLINHRAIGPYHEIRFNKLIDSYSIQPDSLYHNIIGDKKEIIRIYNPGQFIYEDSLEIIIAVSDSLSNKVIDTLEIVFLESKRKPSSFSYTVKYPGPVLVNDPSYVIHFNKPVSTTHLETIYYRADSTFTYHADSLNQSWNENLTELTLDLYLNKDSLFNSYDQSIEKDTVQQDSIPSADMPLSEIGFVIEKGSFISIEKDSAMANVIQHRKSIEEQVGTLKLDIDTQHPSFIVQLLEGGRTATYSIKNETSPVFNIRPSSYTIRILIDSNNDGQWTHGNLIKNIEPEEVYLFPETISVRENWIVEDITISF